MKSVWRARLAGAAAGLANGCFGGGGGMVFLPLMSREKDLSGRQLFATCVAVIFPVCAVSAGVYLLRGGVSILQALPYLAGGLAGGWVGGKLYGKVSMGVVRTTYLIGADGIIEKVWKKVKPDTNAGEIIEYITGEK